MEQLIDTQSLYMDLPETAAYLKIANSTVYKFISRYELPARKHGRKLVFVKSEVDLWSSKRVRIPQRKELSPFEQARRRRLRGQEEK